MNTEWSIVRSTMEGERIFYVKLKRKRGIKVSYTLLRFYEIDFEALRGCVLMSTTVYSKDNIINNV